MLMRSTNFTTLAILAALCFAGTAAAEPAILFSADTEGHVAPCGDCPMHTGRGGLTRRATLLAAERGDALLVDAGNFLYGPATLASNGVEIVAAYNQLRYDAVNVAVVDLRRGLAQTRAAFADAKFTPVSANLVDAATGKPLFAPFVIKVVAGKRIAILGLTEPPAPLESLPHLVEATAGIRIIPSADALASHLDAVRAESDAVVILFHGPAAKLQELCRKVGDTAVVLAGGVRPERVRSRQAFATDEHGKAVARIRLAPTGPTATQLPVLPTLDEDRAMASLLLAIAGRPGEGPTSQPVAQDPPPVTPPVPASAPASRPAIAATRPDEPATFPSTRPIETTQAESPTGPARIAARQPRQPKGLAGVGLTQEQVDAAIRKGADFLWPHVRKEAGEKQKIGANAYEGYHTLAALALVKAGLHHRDPDFNAAVRGYLEAASPETMGTYASGVLCMLVEAYGDPRYEPKLRAAARYLLESLTTRGWDYYPKIQADRLVDPRTRKALQVWGGRPPIGSGANPVERWSRAATQPTAELDHDNSLVQFAVLGLHAAARHGVEVPRETWQQVAQMMRERQGEAGGWGYVGPTSAQTGSMTCASTYALTVARYHLGEKSPAEDVAIERGLGWLAPQFAVAKNPGGGTANLYYYLYSVERLGRTLETEFIGEHEWYPMGAKYLLGVQQENGSWHDETAENRVDLTTSFAILFLSRSTPKLSTAVEPKVGPGMLKTGLLQPPAPRLYVVLDCSGSMMAEMNGQTKFDIARRSISTLLGELPDATQVALRVYGHRKTAVDPGANDDTELLVPMGALDRQGFANTLQRLRARGRTPMARSLQSAVTDLDAIGEKNVELLLLTDGGEDSQPRLDPVAAAAGVSRTRGGVLNVVGFDIGRDDWGRQLREMAAAGNGRYWAAGDDAGLLSELRAAVLRSPGVYQVLTADGKLAHKGMFGDSVQLEPGNYTFQTSFAGRRFEESFWVNAGEPTAVLFDAGKFEVAAPTTAPASPDINPPVSPPPVAVTPATAPANRPKFCVHCGNRLTATGKFCTNCGKKIGE